jgi:hypothetical protein
MIRKVSSISYLGNWDFVKSYIVKQSHLGRQNLAEYLQRVAGIDRLEAERLFQEASALSGLDREEWISQRLNFYFGLFSGKKDGTLIFFDNGIVYNPEGRRAYIYSSVDYAYKVPKSIFIAKDGSLEEVVCRDANTETSILFIQNNGECKSVMLDRDLARSMCVRLYFLEGKGLRYFSPFLEQKDDGGYIRVFKINWDIPRTNNK